MSYTKTLELLEDGRIHAPVEATLDAPPGGESPGDRYTVGAGADGYDGYSAWDGHVGEIAEFDGAEWAYTSLEQGDIVFDINQDLNLIHNGSVLISGGGGGGGSGAPGDDGLGWTSVVYNPSDGKVTFNSDDGLGYTTADIRGDTGTAGDPGAAGDTGPAGSTGPAGGDGAPGSDGATWHTGAGAPGPGPSGLGVPGDLYFRTSNNNVLLKDSTGSELWGVIADVTGATGAAGGDGAPGGAGADGKSVLNGAGVPDDVTDGGVGDFWIDTSAVEIYGPKADPGGWGAGTSLVGGGSGDKIEEGDTSVEVVDTGSDGNIAFSTEGSVRWNMDSNGNLIPATNDAHDIGSAEYKVRDLYLSDSSLWIGDTQKITTHEGKMKFRSRRSTSPFTLGAMPAAGGTRTFVAAGLGAAVGEVGASATKFIEEFDGLMIEPGNAPVLIMENITKGTSARFLVNSFTPEDTPGAVPASVVVDAVDGAVSAFESDPIIDEYVLMLEEQPMLNSSGLIPDTYFLSAEPDLITESGGATGQDFPGHEGDVRLGPAYLYVCTSFNHWKRIPLDDTSW